jgi:hypothetical protein
MPAIARRPSSTTNHIQDSGVAQRNTTQPHSYSHYPSDTLYQTISSGSYPHGHTSSDVDSQSCARFRPSNLTFDVVPEQSMHPGYNLASAIPDERVEDSTTSSSNFTYDFLTPEYSSEYPYSIPSAQTTPSIDDLLWEQNFNDTMAVDPKHTLLSTPFEISPSTRNDGHQATPTPPPAHENRPFATAA